MKFFAAYPSSPDHISISIEETEKTNSSHIQFATWRSTFGAGRLIDQSVLPEIAKADGLICDVSVPNENVFFEIGFAIGKMKPIIPIVNTSVQDAGDYLRKIGLLDNVGQIRYENSADLVYQLQSHAVNGAIFAEPNFEVSRQPLLVLDSLRRNEFSTKLISAVKDLVKFYRTVDPQEEYRLSTRAAWELVNESSAVVVSVYDTTRTDHLFHNIRAAFLAGLAIGLDKECTILVDPNANKPLDFIDVCQTIKHPDDIREAVSELVPKLYQRQLGGTGKTRAKNKRLISQVSVGSNAAENEMRDLEDYFVETHHFKNALEGRGRLVVGRKGAGKTAIFWRVRDISRRKNNELVLDLKPDGYQLRKFKEQLVSLLAVGTKEHTLTAFWEYIIYCEIVHKVLETDYKRLYGRDPKLTPILDDLSELRSVLFEAREGDFSERMMGLIKDINDKFYLRHGRDGSTALQTSEVTELLYATDIHTIQNSVLSYLETRDRTLLLVDNIDKGWGAHGVDPDDVLIVSTLIDALRKVERKAAKNKANLDWLLFLRNDVFELLVDQQNDRGKDGKIVVDWDSEAALQQVIEERIRSSTLARTGKSVGWADISVPTIESLGSIAWLTKRSLMRPRYLIQLVDECIGHADVCGHERIEVEDLKAGFRNFSQDVIGNTSFEMRDISPSSEDAIYALIGLGRKTTLGTIKDALTKEGYGDHLDEIVDLFFWFAVLGASSPNGEEKYIYDYRYDQKLISKMRARADGDEEEIFINHAFAEGLDCVDLI
ncbi:P-loop ATPase, Sll1717 family [Pelagivirga sediminicola]|uniref:P-loop ATPase, Sll1717 family n=1 Tax=Pelagivirga sediminicola TaxID=2170575 RepID=UPI001056F7F4|nr:hypothetical protein [Pelagivirga sediminicola]